MPVSRTMTDLDSNEEVEARLELYQLLDEAETDFQNGDRGITVEALRQRGPRLDASPRSSPARLPAAQSPEDGIS